jgi:hypothetical protein
MSQQQQNHLPLMFRIILFLQIILVPVDVFCAQVTLGWNEITGSNIAGYRIFCREDNGTYNFSKPLWTGSETRIVIKDLVDNKGYYFIVRTYNTAGIESLNSNEVHYQTPQIPTPSEINVLTPTTYAVADLDVGGDTYYLDRTYTLTSIPTGLSTGTEEWIKTRNDDKNLTSEVFLTFTISHNATVYVAYDSRATRLPSWLSNGFKLTSMTIGVSEEMGHFKVYQHDFPAGTVSLGGNMASGAVGASSNYIVVVKPTGSTEPGLVFSSDTISFVVEERRTISQNISLKTSDSSSASYSIGDDASWLSVSPSSGRTPCNLNVTVDANGLSPGTYSATITAVASGYINDTFIVLMEVTSSSSDPFEVNILTPTTYAVADLDVGGDTYYLDRTYTLTSIPTGLTTGTEEWIKTRNDDKNATSAVFLTFTLSHNATVYVAYDSRATRLPSWLSNGFELTSMAIGVSEEMGRFKVYQHDFPAGTVSLGGNMASGAVGASSNYIVVVKPTGSTVFSSDTIDPDHADKADINVNNDWIPDESQDSVTTQVLSENINTIPIVNEYSPYQDNVKSILLEDGQSLTVESPEGTIISKLAIKENPSSSSIPLDDLDFAYGLVDLTIENVDANGSAIVKLYYPEDSSPEAYYKYGPTPDQPEDHWYEFMYDGETGAVIDQNVITLHFVDGKRGDDNLSVTDDKITDTVGGAVFRNSQAIQPESAAISGESSNNAESCFIRCLNLQ